MFGLFSDNVSIFEMQPCLNLPFAFAELDYPCAARKPIPAVGVIAARPAVAETNPVQIATKVVHVVVPNKSAYHIARFVHCGEKSAIQSRRANVFVLLTVAGVIIPNLVVFREWNVEKCECR